jgi:hypothetical protein
MDGRNGGEVTTKRCQNASQAVSRPFSPRSRPTNRIVTPQSMWGRRRFSDFAEDEGEIFNNFKLCVGLPHFFRPHPIVAAPLTNKVTLLHCYI